MPGLRAVSSGTVVRFRSASASSSAIAAIWEGSSTCAPLHRRMLLVSCAECEAGLSSMTQTALVRSYTIRRRRVAASAREEGSAGVHRDDLVLVRRDHGARDAA